MGVTGEAVRNRFRRGAAWAQARFWQCADIGLMMRLCRLPVTPGVRALRDRLRGVTCERLRRGLVDTPDGIGYPVAMRRRTMLDAAVCSAAPSVMPMLEACAAQLDEAMLRASRRGVPPVLAPLHVCSDITATVVAALTTPRRTHVFSIYGQERIGFMEARHLQAQGIAVIQHAPDASSGAHRAIMRELRERTANLVIFPDILPQFSEAYLGYPMRTRDVSLFGRQARLHVGAETFARMAGGGILPFYVYWEADRLAIRIFDACDDLDDVARCLEQALRAHGDQWLLWHYASLFYFNDSAER